MRAIIVAGGQGKRLQPYTTTKPKCLLPFGGTTVLERQLEMFRSRGIYDIVVLKWYLEQLINFKDVRYYIDPELQNMLFGIFNAEKELEGNIIISYGDIVYDLGNLIFVYSAEPEIFWNGKFR